MKKRVYISLCLVAVLHINQFDLKLYKGVTLHEETIVNQHDLFSSSYYFSLR
ncbi:hypothetical protein EMIT0210MI2_10253 [Priestia megaterium]